MLVAENLKTLVVEGWVSRGAGTIFPQIIIRTSSKLVVAREEGGALANRSMSMWAIKRFGKGWKEVGRRRRLRIARTIYVRGLGNGCRWLRWHAHTSPIQRRARMR